MAIPAADAQLAIDIVVTSVFATAIQNSGSPSSSPRCYACSRPVCQPPRARAFPRHARLPMTVPRSPPNSPSEPLSITARRPCQPTPSAGRRLALPSASPVGVIPSTSPRSARLRTPSTRDMPRSGPGHGLRGRLGSHHGHEASTPPRFASWVAVASPSSSSSGSSPISSRLAKRSCLSGLRFELRSRRRRRPRHEQPPVEHPQALVEDPGSALCRRATPTHGPFGSLSSSATR